MKWCSFQIFELSGCVLQALSNSCDVMLRCHQWLVVVVCQWYCSVLFLFCFFCNSRDCNMQQVNCIKCKVSVSGLINFQWLKNRRHTLEWLFWLHPSCIANFYEKGNFSLIKRCDVWQNAFLMGTGNTTKKTVTEKLGITLLGYADITHLGTRPSFKLFWVVTQMGIGYYSTTSISIAGRSEHCRDKCINCHLI